MQNGKIWVRKRETTENEIRVSSLSMEKEKNVIQVL